MKTRNRIVALLLTGTMIFQQAGMALAFDETASAQEPITEEEEVFEGLEASEEESWEEPVFSAEDAGDISLLDETIEDDLTGEDEEDLLVIQDEDIPDFFDDETLLEETWTEADEDWVIEEEEDAEEITVELAASEVKASGTCGTSASWQLDSEETLTISGTGMASNHYWEKHRPSVKKVIVADGITGFTDGWFGTDYGSGSTPCTSLEEVILGKSVTEIVGSAFQDCTNLKSVSMPGVQSIGESAFNNCALLQSVTLGSGLKLVSYDAFYGCSSLSTVSYPGSEEDWNQIDIEDFNESLRFAKGFSISDGGDWGAIHWFIEGTTLTITGSGAIPDVTGDFKDLTGEMASKWYKYRDVIRNVVIGYGITYVGNYVFNANHSDSYQNPVETITFKGTAPEFAQKAFGTWLSSGAVSSAIVYYPAGDDTWTSDIVGQQYGGSSITWKSYAVETPVTVVASGDCGDDAHWKLDSEGTLTIYGTGTVDRVPTAFSDGTVRKMVVEDGITALGDTVQFRETGEGKFTSLEEVVFADTLKTTGPLLFKDCTALRSVKLSAGMEEIRGNSFDGCSALTEITIPDAVHTINGYAFRNCENLKSVVLPANLEMIDRAAFEGCHSLNAVSYAGSKSLWSDIKMGNVNGQLIRAYGMPVSGQYGDASWTYADGVLTIKGIGQIQDSYTWIQTDNERTTQQNAKEFAITENWFWLIDAVEEVVIGESITYVGSRMFSVYGYETNLHKITFEGIAPSLADTAFYGLTAYVYYPAYDATWTTDILGNQYGGSINWIPYETEITLPASGTCGDSAAWTVTEDGILTISGSGIVNDLSGVTRLRDRISHIVIESGIQGFADGIAFTLDAGYYSLNNVWYAGTWRQYSRLSYTSLTDRTVYCVSLESTTFEYIGMEIVPDVLVYGNEGNAVDADEMVDVVYSDNVRVGTGYAYISFPSYEGIFFTLPFAITKAVNRWTQGLACDNVAYGDAPAPLAKARYGTASYLYSTTKTGNYTSDVPKQVGTWYVKAVVAESELYTGLTSDPFSFAIVNGKVTIKPHALTIYEGETSQLELCIPEDLDAGKVESWESSDKSIVSVVDGLITGTGGGTAYVTAETEEDYYDSCTVKVIPLVERGQCGDDLYWYVYGYEGDYELVIKGSGAMWDVDPDGFFDAVNIFPSKRSEIKKIRIEEGLTYLGSHAFTGYNSAEEIDLPETLNSIGNYAFYKMSGLKYLTLPDSLKTLGEGVFEYCAELIRIRIPDAVTKIPYHAFYGDEKLKTVALPKNLISIGQHAFSNCTRLRTITIPGTVQSIGEGAFNCCYSLSGSVTIPDGITQLETSVFSDCRKLKEIILPAGLEKIDNYAFERCRRLVNAEIPDSVTYIGSGAFSNCSQLDSIKLPSRLTYIGDNAFYYCTAANGNLSMPSSVTKIGSYAFYFCSQISGNLQIPDGITKIEDSAFAYCYALTGITLPEGLEYIGRYAFAACSSVGSICIPETVTFIGPYALQNTGGLSLVLPAGLEAIGVYAAIRHDASELGYEGCVIYPGTMAKWDEVSIDDEYSSAEDRISYSPLYFVTCEGVNYTTDGCTPALQIVNESGVVLREGTDYFVSFINVTNTSDNIYADVVFTGRYVLSGSFRLSMNPDDILVSKIEIEDIPNQTYTGEEICPPVTVEVAGRILTEGTDYQAVYSNNVNANTNQGASANVHILFQGNYFGSADAQFEIDPKNAESAVIEEIPDQFYTGSTIVPEVEVSLDGITLIRGKDYNVTGRNNVEMGEATARLTFLGNYTSGSILSKKFRIVKDGSQAEIEQVGGCLYTGEAIEPEISVTMDGTALVRGEDYDITYHDNVEIGTAWMNIAFTGYYVGEVSQSFVIFQNDVSEAMVITPAAECVYDGAPQEPGFVVRLLGKMLAEGTDYSVKYSDNIAAGTATAVITYIGKDYTGETTVQYEIQKAVYDMSHVRFDNHTYYTDGTWKVSLEIEGELPEGVTVRYENNGRTEEGTSTVTAYFDADTVNHEEITPMTADLTVTRDAYQCDHKIRDDVKNLPDCMGQGHIYHYCEYYCGFGWDEYTDPLEHDIQYVPEVPATCTDYGTRGHWQCSRCGKSFFDEVGMSEAYEYDLTIPATGHLYDAPVFIWEESGETFYIDGGGSYARWNVAGTMTCSVCGQPADLMSSWVDETLIQVPTMDQEGQVHFTAHLSFADSPDYYTEEKDVIIPRINRTYGEAQFEWITRDKAYPTARAYVKCNQDPTDVVWLDTETIVLEDMTVPATCTEDGRLYLRATAAFGDRVYTQDYEDMLHKTGHDYEAPVFVWTEDPSQMISLANGAFIAGWSVTGTVKCKNEEIPEVIDVYPGTGSPYLEYPTASHGGKASFYVNGYSNGYEYYDEKTIYLPAVGAEYGQPVFEWHERPDGERTATASVVPSQDDPEISVMVDMSSETKKATCTEEGRIIYRASAVWSGREYTDEYSMSLPMTTHSLIYHEAYEATCTENGQMGYWHCETCGKYFQDSDGYSEFAAPTDVIIPARGHMLDHFDAVAPGCETSGNAEYWYCSECEHYFADAEGTVINEQIYLEPLGHERPDYPTVIREATFDESGEAVWYCTRCGKQIGDPVSIPQLVRGDLTELQNKLDALPAEGDLETYYSAEIIEEVRNARAVLADAIANGVEENSTEYEKLCTLVSGAQTSVSMADWSSREQVREKLNSLTDDSTAFSEETQRRIAEAANLINKMPDSATSAEAAKIMDQVNQALDIKAAETEQTRNSIREQIDALQGLDLNAYDEDVRTAVSNILSQKDSLDGYSMTALRELLSSVSQAKAAVDETDEKKTEEELKSEKEKVLIFISEIEQLDPSEYDVSEDADSREQTAALNAKNAVLNARTEAAKIKERLDVESASLNLTVLQQMQDNLSNQLAIIQTEQNTYDTVRQEVKAEKDQLAANNAISLISNLVKENGSVNEEELEKAQAAFNSLTEDQKALIDTQSLQDLQKQLNNAQTALENQLKAEEERKAAEAKAEEERKAAEAKAEEERKAAEARAEEERKAAEAKAEAERKAAEAKAEAERKAAEAKAEAERKAAEEKAKAEEAQKNAESKERADQSAADAVAVQISKALSGGSSNETAVDAALAAYDKLTDVQKKLVDADSVTKLKNAKAAIETSKKEAEEQKQLEIEKAKFSLNVKNGQKNIPIQWKKNNSKIQAVTLGEGDYIKTVTSDKPAIVTASVKGGKTIVLKGLKNKGKATITVLSNLGAKVTFSVKVQKGKVKTKSVKVATKTKVTLKVGQTLDLAPVINPVTTADKVKYATSAKKVALVKKGIITAKKTGTAKITVKCGTKKKVITVKVTK